MKSDWVVRVATVARLKATGHHCSIIIQVCSESAVKSIRWPRRHECLDITFLRCKGGLYFAEHPQAHCFAACENYLNSLKIGRSFKWSES